MNKSCLPLIFAMLIAGSAHAASDASTPGATSPDADAANTQTPSEASRKADETMSKDAPRPVPGKDAKPGPVAKEPPADSHKADGTMSEDAPRKY